jgi:hypothetical protein
MEVSRKSFQQGALLDTQGCLPVNFLHWTPGWRKERGTEDFQSQGPQDSQNCWASETFSEKA